MKERKEEWRKKEAEDYQKDRISIEITKKI